MYCERCRALGANGNEPKRSRRRPGAARCARCGTVLPTRLASVPKRTVDTNTHLARFGLAITGEPLLELNARGARRCVES